MSQSKTDKKNMKASSPQVMEFVCYLDSLIKARTSENKLVRAAGVGKSKLSTYLDGTDVPGPRVLQHYILKPLETFALLTEDELATLMQLHEEACRVQPARAHTNKDTIKFLEEDLARTQDVAADLTRRLNSAISMNIADSDQAADLTRRLNSAMTQNVADSDQIVQMRAYQHELRIKLTALTEQTESLRCELERTRLEYRGEQGASQRLAEFTGQKRRELETCQEELNTCKTRIFQLEQSVRKYAAVDAELRRQLHILRKENGILRQRNTEERYLFMRLVAHAANSKALVFMSRRIERGEQMLLELTAANKALTEMHSDSAAEIGRVTMERDFISAALRAAERDNGQLAADNKALTEAKANLTATAEDVYAKVGRVVGERDFLHAALCESERDNGQLAANNKALTETKANLTAEVKRLHAEVDQLTQERDFLRIPLYRPAAPYSNPNPYAPIPKSLES